MIIDDSTVIQKEFLVFQLPSAYFIIAALYRLYQLKGHTEQEEDKEPSSVHVKVYLCIWIAAVYFIEICFGYFGFMIRFNNDIWFMLYFIPIGAQCLAATLVKQEFKFNEQQATWTHRVFWPFQSLFIFLRMIQSYQTLLAATIIFLQFVPSIPLFLYGLYKPNDRSHLPMETPRFVKELLYLLESHSWFQVEKTNTLLTNRHSIKHATVNLQEFTNMIQRASHYEQDSFIKQKLPDITASINKKLVKKFVNDNEILYYYEITTVIDKSSFVVERRYPDFLNLERYQLQIYQNANKINKLEIKFDEDDFTYITRRKDTLESWLCDMLANPTFINKVLLEFLGVSTKSQAPFLVYQSILMTKTVQQQKKPNPQEQEIEMQQFDEEEVKKQVQNYGNLQFSSKCTRHQRGQYGDNSTEFIIQIKYYDKTFDNSYQLIKTLSCIKAFNQQLESTLSRSVYKFHIGPKSTNSEKVAIVDQYFKVILLNPEFFCKELFEFIQFDIETKQPISQ